jgi:hypothetical protein
MGIKPNGGTVALTASSANRPASSRSRPLRAAPCQQAFRPGQDDAERSETSPMAESLEMKMHRNSTQLNKLPICPTV